MGEEGNIDELAYMQRLKAAVHYTSGRICEEIGQEMDVTFSRQFISALAETTFKQMEIFSEDLEAFAQHAKRTTVSSDDVKLLARRSSDLLAHINSLSAKQAAENDAAKEKKGKRGRKPKPVVESSTDEEE
ncbi:centromere protein S-like [Diadema antillarum]|uniref:centromere protein S-like n=1 Tax=Diadema antillarum TaxID=105358 RepID=UPI003A8BFA23